VEKGSGEINMAQKKEEWGGKKHSSFAKKQWRQKRNSRLPRPGRNQGEVLVGGASVSKGNGLLTKALA